MLPDRVQTFAEAVGPWIPLISIVISGIIVGGFAAYNRRKGAAEDKEPTVPEIWAELRQMRGEMKQQRTDMDAQASQLRHAERDRDLISSAFSNLRSVLINFAERVRSGGNVELTAAELRALELPVISDDQWPTLSPEQRRTQ